MPGRKKKAKASWTLISFLAPIALVQVILLFVFVLNIFFVAAMQFLYAGGVPTAAFYVVAIIAAALFVVALYAYYKKANLAVYLLAAVSGTLLGLLISGTFAGAVLS
jgi:hypothetical protein